MVLFIANARTLTALDDLVDALDAGTGAAIVRIYDGAIPTDADTAIGAQNVLATLTCQTTCFGNASDAGPGAVATAALPIEDTSADLGGTATFFRAYDSAITIVMQGSVTATGMGGDMEINTVSIALAALVSITSWTVTLPES